jgi:hypothetical protein
MGCLPADEVGLQDSLLMAVSGLVLMGIGVVRVHRTRQTNKAL